MVVIKMRGANHSKDIREYIVDDKAVELSPELPSLCLSIAEQSPLAMAAVEGPGHIVRYLNPAFCRLLGKNAQELIGRPFAEMMPGKDEYLALMDNVFRTGEPQSHEQDGDSPDPVYWSCTIWPVQGAGQSPIGILLLVTESAQFHQRSVAMSEALLVGSVRQHELVEAADLLNARLELEIIERKRAEEALRHAQALLTARAALLEQTVQERTAKLQETIGELEYFSYTIAHDMRAPLRTLQGFGELIAAESEGRMAPNSVINLRRIMDGAARMDALIRDALQYTKILRGEIPLNPIEPTPVLRGILESYPALQTPAANIQIVDPLPSIIANEAGLIQCFANLLGNAVKFVPPGVKPEIRVWAENRGDLARFWIADNGIGIAGEFHERIFGMFRQLETNYEGTGIGLALVRKAAERMGGKVGIESEPGKGSRFWLEFKRAEA